MSLANFKPQRIASALRGFLAAARLSCYVDLGCTFSFVSISQVIGWDGWMFYDPVNRLARKINSENDL